MQLISPIMRDNILILAKEYARLRKLKLRTVSRYVRNDQFFLNDLAHNRVGVTSWKYDEILAYFEANWPPGTPMPFVREFK